MKDYESGYTPLVKGDMSSLNQCPKNDLEIQKIRRFLYFKHEKILNQVCMRSVIAYITVMLE